MYIKMTNKYYQKHNEKLQNVEEKVYEIFMGIKKFCGTNYFDNFFFDYARTVPFPLLWV